MQSISVDSLLYAQKRIVIHFLNIYCLLKLVFIINWNCVDKIHMISDKKIKVNFEFWNSGYGINMLTKCMSNVIFYEKRVIFDSVEKVKIMHLFGTEVRNYQSNIVRHIQNINSTCKNKIISIATNLGRFIGFSPKTYLDSFF